MGETKDYRINIRFSEEDYKAVEKAAEKDNRTLSDFCRLKILAVVKKGGKRAR